MNTSLTNAPERKWERSGNFTEDGKPLWFSRPWNPGEKAAYLASIALKS